ARPRVGGGEVELMPLVNRVAISLGCSGTQVARGDEITIVAVRVEDLPPVGSGDRADAAVGIMDETDRLAVQRAALNADAAVAVAEADSGGEALVFHATGRAEVVHALVRAGEGVLRAQRFTSAGGYVGLNVAVAVCQAPAESKRARAVFLERIIDSDQIERA